MEVRVMSKDAIELQLKPEEMYLTEKGIRELIKRLLKGLIEMKEFERGMSDAEKQGTFSFG